MVIILSAARLKEPEETGSEGSLNIKPFGGMIMARFTLPRDLYHGKGALEALKTFTGKRAMICVGGGSMKRFGFLDRAISYLKEAGMEVEVFEGIEPDPSVDTVMRGAEAMAKFQPDWIIAMASEPLITVSSVCLVSFS